MTTSPSLAPAGPDKQPPTLELTVVEVIDETEEARSIVFEPPPGPGGAPFSYRPGQFLTVRVPSSRPGTVARCYSLSSAPTTDARPKVTIKRTAGGYASNWLCDNLRVGDTVEVLPPAGSFTPSSTEEDVILFAAGSGISPVMSILKAVLDTGEASVTLVYANRDEASVIFAEELRRLCDLYPRRLAVVHWLESLLGLPNATALAGLVDDHVAARQRSAYVCGPVPFMAAAQEALALLDVPRSRVHREVYTSLSSDPFAATAVPDLADAAQGEPDASVRIELDGDVHQLSWPRGWTLVDLMRANDLDVPYSCLEGECGSCSCVLTEGEAEMDRNEVLDDEDLADGYILACRARPVSGELAVEF